MRQVKPLGWNCAHFVMHRLAAPESCLRKDSLPCHASAMLCRAFRAKHWGFRIVLAIPMRTSHSRDSLIVKVNIYSDRISRIANHVRRHWVAFVCLA